MVRKNLPSRGDANCVNKKPNRKNLQLLVDFRIVDFTLGKKTILRRKTTSNNTKIDLTSHCRGNTKTVESTDHPTQANSSAILWPSLTSNTSQ
ncbi:unnamed protein product, partial [Nesidiocoris tenuis]